MRLLLVIPKYNPGDKANYDYTFPLGLAYISAVIKKAGYKLDCLNLNHLNGKTSDLVKKALDNNKYELVLTGNNAQGYSMTEEIIQAVHNHPSKPKFILGGHIITSEPDLIFNALNSDYAIIGEGEETILELLNALKQAKNLSKVRGVIYKEQGKTIKTLPRSPPENLDSLPFPDVEGLDIKSQLDNIHTNYAYHTHAFDNPRPYSLLTSRSCPFQCTFCYHESRYRPRSIKNIMKELNERVKKYKINTLIIYDECLALDKARLKQLCEEIIKLKKQLSWDLKWTCQMRVEGVDRNILREMKKAGCETISYGFESFSPIVLKSMRKTITPQQIDKAFKDTLAEKIGIQANFIFGDVAETKSTSQLTLNYWKKNCKGQVRLGFIQPYPDSEIYRHCIKKGIIKDKLDFLKNKMNEGVWFNMTNSMTDKEVNDLRKKILNYSRKYSKITLPLKISNEKNNTYRFDVVCPFCKKKNSYGNCFIDNKHLYDFYMTCRNCNLRFYIVSPVQKLVYLFYPLLRSLKDSYSQIRNIF